MSSIILYEKADYWVTPARRGGYEVFKNTGTHSVRCAQIGYQGQEGLEKAKQEIERRLENTGDRASQKGIQ